MPPTAASSWRSHEATLLHRSDNDMEYLPGWCDEVVRCFDENPRLGQLGLRTVEEEGPVSAVGGNAVFRREVWDAGARYDERPWQECKFEDGAMSQTVQGAEVHMGASAGAVRRAYRHCFQHRSLLPADLLRPRYHLRGVGSGMRVLITGVAGFIGSHLAEAFHLLGYQVVGVDNFETGRKRTGPRR